ncbi:MAG: alkaline phosphatase family protein [Prevotellaceae bacterium]|nr:alkaline phosphatase family protein [Prevotellaceae bacterium]
MSNAKKLLLLLFTLAGISATAQRKLPSDKPKLIVQIVVGQLRNDYLLRFKNNLNSEGFYTFMYDGMYCNNARYQYMLTQTAPGLATIATGANPAQHGITSDSWYDRAGNKIQEACYDYGSTPLESSNDKLRKSPRKLLASTFSDELKLLNKKSKVFGVAFNPEEAILLSGHNANAAFWMDDVSGNFTTSDYYISELPSWVKDFNQKNFADTYLNRNWDSFYPIEKYITATEQQKTLTASANYSFLDLAKKNATKRREYSLIRETPYGDNLTKDFAISLIVGENLGRDNTTDFLSIYFSAVRDLGDEFGTLSPELEDAIYRTDENIKHLLAFLNRQVGKENVLVILTSDHGCNLSQAELAEAKMPNGIFENNKAMLLLKSYLNIVYGKGDWVKTFHQKQVYLNRTLIEDAGQRAVSLPTRAADFLIQFTGVANVMTSSTLESSNFSVGVMRNIQNGYYPKRSGDIIINLESGWIDNSSVTNSNSPYTYDVHVPLAFYGWKVKRKTVTRLVDMTSVAPTLSALSEIPTPNAAVGEPIEELFE